MRPRATVLSAILATAAALALGVAGAPAQAAPSTAGPSTALPAGMLHVVALAQDVSATTTVRISHGGTYVLISDSAKGGGKLITVATDHVVTLPSGIYFTDVNENEQALGHDATGSQVDSYIFTPPNDLEEIQPQSESLTGGVNFSSTKIIMSSLNDTPDAVGTETGTCSFPNHTTKSCQVAVQFDFVNGVKTSGAVATTGCSNTVGNTSPATGYVITDANTIFGSGCGGTPCPTQYFQWAYVAPPASSAVSPWACAVGTTGVVGGNRSFNSTGAVLVKNGYYFSTPSVPSKVTISVPAGTTLAPASINAGNEVVGTLSGTQTGAFVYSVVGGLQSLASVSDAAPSVWTLTKASDISDNDIVIGIGANSADKGNDVFVAGPSADLPVTAPSKLTLAAAPTSIIDGSKSTLTATLAKTAGGAVSGQKITLQSRAGSTGTFATVSSATTSSSGKATFSVAATATKQYRAVHAATATSGASTSSTVTLTVHYKVSLSASPSKVAKGKPSVLTVTVAPKAAGRSVQLQDLVGTTWKNLGSAHKLASTSKVAVTLKPTKTLKYRATITAVAADAAGTSSAVTITVKT